MEETIEALLETGGKTSCSATGLRTEVSLKHTLMLNNKSIQDTYGS